jgi:ABC-type oligopeptide transport system substrate-binding subunit
MENVVARNPDWAKRGSTIVTSGPYKLGKVKFAEDGGKEYDKFGTNEFGNPFEDEKSCKTQKISYFYLERNAYYNRDPESDPIDKSVKNFRLLVDCSKTDAEILDDYKNGKLFYMGDIPLSIRNDEFVKANVQLSNSLSTTVVTMNQNASVSAGRGVSYNLFADSNVRKALSFVIDREAIAEMLVYAEAATALVAPGVFNTDRSSDFRTIGGNILSKSPKFLEAKMFLANAGIIDQNGRNNAMDYSFTIKVASYNDEHIAIANMLAGMWGEDGLGFDVSVELVNPIQNNDYFKEYDEISKDICDDLFVEDLQQGDYQVAIYDSVAYTADAFSVLAGFAAPFSGTAADSTDFSKVAVHPTGYNNEAYNALIEAAYYVPYIASLSENDWNFLGIYNTPEEFKDAYNKILKTYEKYGVTPSTNSKDWEAQRAKFLHAAEEILMEDVPVIPLVFNKTAVLVSEDLKNVESDFYMPAIFTKTTLKGYENYEYTVDKVNNKGEIVYDVNGDPVQVYKTIFDEFPFIDWAKVTE